MLEILTRKGDGSSQRHNTTGQTVLVTLDGQPLANDGATSSIWHPSDLSLSLVSSLVSDAGGTPIVVQAYGTFTVKVHISMGWSVGSVHHLRVDNEQKEELKSLDFSVEGGQATPTSTPTPTPTLIPTSVSVSVPETMPTPTPTPQPTPTPTPTPTPKPRPIPMPTPTPKV
jgi:hypothetical protein